MKCLLDFYKKVFSVGKIGSELVRNVLLLVDGATAGSWLHAQSLCVVLRCLTNLLELRKKASAHFHPAGFLRNMAHFPSILGVLQACLSAACQQPTTL